MEDACDENNVTTSVTKVVPHIPPDLRYPKKEDQEKEQKWSELVEVGGGRCQLMGRINRALAAAAQSGLIELWHACLGPLLLSYLMTMMILMTSILMMMTTMYSLYLLNCGMRVMAFYYHHH